MILRFWASGLLSLAFGASSGYAATGFKAGVATVRIAPERSLWMAGFAARTRPSEGVSQELYAKALALEDETGKRAVLVTTDLLGLTAAVSENITRRIQKQYGLARDRVLLNSSHTHCGPVVDDMLAVAYDLTPQQWADIQQYTRQLEDKVVSVVGSALRARRPARLSFGRSAVGFGQNRRIKINPNGPVDHDVPILRVEDQSGSLRAIVFGYACHNTTIGADYCLFNGDYAGYAQSALEKQHPGAVAFFMTGCGADVNPSPRGSVEWAEKHGNSLASTVTQGLSSSLDAVRGPLSSRFEYVSLTFAKPPSRDELQSRLSAGNIYEQRHARKMLELLERKGRLPETYSYPIQVWQFGPDLTMVALAGEVVVDYALRLKERLGASRLWVSGYSNDVFAYIPSRRVLEEGGYEGGGAMIYYVQPGPFAPSVEETILAKVEAMVRALRPGSASGRN